ncbi:hypothetical protein BP5796_07921 [Coleophoma crateriformis]|uniref:Uncharacterized protein n=1 Tax=Coleophoma crateriformis TaxID=565419 RepID=A0A3D8RCV7_9HELO|nr:hypothetical protein BP5796_07921 [Coleophoma crateriformis]
MISRFDDRRKLLKTRLLTVSQLVATSTVGIAAAGLALGKPEQSAHGRPTSKKRKAGDINTGSSRPSSLLIPRPATAFTPETRSSGAPSQPLSGGPPTTLRISNPSSETSRSIFGRRFSIARHGDPSSPQDALSEDPRDSVSSRGSWMRRLSALPISQNNSARSSMIGPESPSFSNGSAAPILVANGITLAPLPPNKLVKRSTSGKSKVGRARSGTTSQLPSLRRPATSHQRSVTLQQQQPKRTNSKKSSHGLQDSPASEAAHDQLQTKHAASEYKSTWWPFLESRPTRLSRELLPGRTTESSLQRFQSTVKRVFPDDAVRPTLVKPAMITTIGPGQYYEYESLPFEELDDDNGEVVDESALPSLESGELHKRPRRSLSMHFNSPGSWITRSTSLRATKRSTEGNPGGRRYASAPISTIPGRDTVSAHQHDHGRRVITDPSLFQGRPLSPVIANDPFSPTSFQTRSRNCSSPLPPISRLSSFNLDLARLGMPSSASSAPRSPILNSGSSGRMSPTSSTYYTTLNSRGPRTSELTDRGSTLVGSDNEGKQFLSGDDDDIDFISEIVYDSLRTATTGSMRSYNTPLDSMFDESPPNMTNNNNKKRLSVHEMISNGTFLEGNRIVEEDEGMPTPVKGSQSQSHQEEGFRTPVHKPVDAEEPFPSSPPNFLLASKDFNGLSLDDGPEEDEDWNKDDENTEFGSPLSPPSHPSNSVNSRRVDASFRAALADVTHTGSVNGNGMNFERPRSNLFDWSEPSVEKPDFLGNSPRPRTAHVKQMADSRGGRAIGRRGPSALHIRSQSVPVAPDPAGQRDSSKSGQKFGTWGLGAKGVSEDWDNDFEFEGGDEAIADDGDSKLETSGMLVPPAIQASQASVVGHVGQIREVCLLVEDLKRLRILGREKGLLSGSSAPLWKEAEGIIALAAPDEDDSALSPPHSPTTDFDNDMVDSKFLDHGPDADVLSVPEAPFEVLNNQGRPAGLIYDGTRVRRKSVFSPEDDIFGSGGIINTPQQQENLRPKPTTRASSPRLGTAKNSAEVARSVMETMHQHRSTSDPLLSELTTQSANKMPFDTTSLRDLVHRANILSRTLADLVRKADGFSPSPEVSPRRESSPAFTRVFTDPMASPPKHLPRSQSNNSVLSGSMDSSPSRSLGQRMHMMTVV